MSEGKRPGGLTALAVLNFVFGAFGALGLVGFLVAVMFVRANGLELDPHDEAGRAGVDALRNLSNSALATIAAISFVAAALLITSGVGILKLRRRLGRQNGNLAALASLAEVGIKTAFLDAAAGGGFNLGTLVSMLYPLITLILLNSTFKEDFVH